MRVRERLGRALRSAARAGVAPVGVLALALAPWPLIGVGALAAGVWLAATHTGRQTASVALIGLATIPRRLGAAAVVVVGIAGVVGVLVGLLAMGAGFEATLRQTGTDDTAIVIRGGAQTEINSVMDHDTVAIIAQAPQVQQGPGREPIASPELVVVAAIPKKSSGLDANVELRGIGERAWTLRPQVRMVAGRRFNPGMRELVVGHSARAEFAGLEPGSVLALSGQRWTVVGVFDSGDAHNSELWGDVRVVGPAYRRGTGVTSVTVRLTEAGAFGAFKAALVADPRLKVDVKTTRSYYNDQSANLSRLIRILGSTVAVIMAIGAVFGALNTMYAAVAARAREIATLRAIGFRGLPVIVAVLLETLALALLGGILGALIAWALFHDYTASTLGTNFSQVVFTFSVTPALVLAGVKWAMAIGFLGGFYPALRAATVPVTAGLRES